MKTTVRWALQHGVVRAATARAARKGDLHASFMRDERWRVDPFPFYEQAAAGATSYAGGWST